MAKLSMILLISVVAVFAQETSPPDTTTSAIDCLVSLGSSDSPVDGSFETLGGVAATSTAPRLNGDVTSGGWFNGVNTADSFVAPYVYTAMNVPESPDGGVFVGAASGSWVNNNGEPASYEESFYTTVEGLVVGTAYTIKFYQACPADAYGRSLDGNQGAWDITFGSETIVSPTCTYQQGPAVWSEVSLTFTPTSATQRLEFLSKDIFNAGRPHMMNYMAVDGITVTPNIPRCIPTQLPTSSPSASTTAIPTNLPTVTALVPKCVDISGCYTLDFSTTGFSYLEAADETMCVYRLKFALIAQGMSGLRAANPTHLRFFVDSNTLRSQVEMGFLDETTGVWTEDSAHRVTTNEFGVEYKMDLEWSNRATYIASEVCPSDSPTTSPSASVPSQSPSASIPSISPSASTPSMSPSASIPSISPSASTPSMSPSTSTSATPTSLPTVTATVPSDSCLHWVERFEYLDHACASESSVFERSELPSYKMWSYSNKFGWYTYTQNMDNSECRALCEATTRCVAFAYQPTVDQAESGCFLYSEENCAAIVADGGYKISDRVFDCSISNSTTTTIETSAQTTLDPQEAACPNGNTLDFLGNGRCAKDGAIVDWPAAGYFLKTTKEDCLAQCDANPDCTGAITAYGYYCAHYLSSDITMFDGEPSTYQTQWECHAKCHNVNHEGTCNEFLVDYRIPGSSMYHTTRVGGNPIDGYYLPANCAKECEKDVQCKAFTFDTSGNTCYLGNSAELIPCDLATGNCGRFPGRMTSGSCDNTGSDGEDSVCPRGFTPHGENGELNIKNHPTGAWPLVDTIEECAAHCETVSCISFEYDTKSKLCATHTEADLSTGANPTGWIACLLDTDAPSLAPTPASNEGEECPNGFYQVGDLSTNNDIGGYGMSTKAEVYTYATFDDCIERCDSMPGCVAFNWNQAGMCVYYDDKVPNRDDGRGFLFCARYEESTTVPDCELSLGTNASPVDGSFESLRYVAATSDNPTMNGNVNGAGWRNGMKTADSFLAPFHATAFNAYANMNVPESPDGGVFAAGGALLDNQGNEIWAESFYTTVENLQIGEEYTVKFYQSTTWDPYGRSVDGNIAAWEVHFGDAMQMAPTLTYDSSVSPAVWSRVSLTFVAGSDSERLEFISRPLGGSADIAQWMNYILIDGISVTPNVPECADPTMSPTTAQPTAIPSATPTTPMPTNLPTFQPTPEPTRQPTELVQIPYNGPEYFCSTHGDPHLETWHLTGASWQDYRIDLDSRDPQLHRGDWLIFEYGAYQVILSHGQERLWNTHMYIKKSGAVIYSYSGRTAERVIDHAEVEVVTNPDADRIFTGINYRRYNSLYEYEWIKLRNIPLEAVWLQKKAHRDASSSESRSDGYGAMMDIDLKWNEDWRVTSGVCSATKDTYSQFKLGEDIFGTDNGRRELVQETDIETCPTLNQCCGRLAGLVNQFESCQLDNYDLCCSSGADPMSCCGGWVQDAPRCTEDSCGNGEACNLIDGYCYPEAQIAAVTAYKGTCHSQVDVNLDLNLCSVESGALVCDQTTNTDKCANGFAYLSKTIGGTQETTFYDSCEFEWYVEYSCEAPVIACPSNYVQVGAFGSQPDDTTVLTTDRTIENISECKSLCEEDERCIAFKFSRPGEEMSNEFVCTLYNSVVPTQMRGTGIFCKSMDAPIVGTVTFDAEFDFINTKCGELLEPLRQVVSRVSRVELRHVRTTVKNCETGSYSVEIDVESASELEPLRAKVQEDVFVQRLNHELESHGKRSTSALTNVSTSSDSDSYKTAFYVVTIVTCLLLVALTCMIYRQSCAKTEDEFDPELAEKRHPEFKPEISLKAMEVPEVDSNGISQSGTFFENVWENVNTSTTPHGEQLPTQ